MPTYVYYDPDTEEEREITHSMSEEPEIINPTTGNKMRKRITGGMGVIYKGKGWTGGGDGLTVHKDDNYHIDRQKDEIRSGIKEDPYSKWRDEPL